METDKQRTLGFETMKTCKQALADGDIRGARAALDKTEVCTYVCMYVCICVCVYIYVCVYVCMYM